MRLSIVDTDELSPATVGAWRPGASRLDAGIVFVDGPHLGIIAPTATAASWLHGRYGDAATIVTELAGLVYHHKGWFAQGLDPLTLRDRRAGQYELRVLTEIDGKPVPLFAMDLAPIRHDGAWSTLDQGRSNGVASLLEIAVVSPDETVAIDGIARRLGGIDLSRSTTWEASRLASITELLRDLDRVPGGPAADALLAATNAMLGLGADETSAVHDAARGLFGVCLAWSFGRLPIETVVGLSQGHVVRAFTAMVAGGDASFHRNLSIERWHADCAAFAYAPGYFATGKVRGYSIDAVASRHAMLDVALMRLERARDALAAAAAA